MVAVLDGIQDPGNAGAILRAAEAFGATGAAFLKGSVSPYNPKCMRASAGSVFRLPIAAALDETLLLAAVGKKRGVLYAAMPRADVLVSDANFKISCAIVIGSVALVVSPSASRTVMPSTAVPGPAGIPVICPLPALITRPAGSPLADHRSAPCPPVAARLVA